MSSPDSQLPSPESDEVWDSFEKSFRDIERQLQEPPENTDSDNAEDLSHEEDDIPVAQPLDEESLQEFFPEAIEDHPEIANLADNLLNLIGDDETEAVSDEESQASSERIHRFQRKTSDEKILPMDLFQPITEDTEFNDPLRDAEVAWQRDNAEVKSFIATGPFQRIFFDEFGEVRTGLLKTVKVSFVIGVLALIASVFYLQNKEKPSHLVSAPDIFDPISAFSDTIKGYLMAENPEDKEAFVRDPQRVRPLMDAWYAENSEFHTPPKDFTIKSAIPQHRLSDKDFYLTRILISPSNEEALFYIEHSPHGSKIDWEATVQHQTSDWDRFVEEGKTEPTEFRVRLFPETYFNPPYTKENGYVCWQIEHPSRNGATLYGYVKRPSEVEAVLRKALADRAILKLPDPTLCPTIKIAYPKNRRDSMQVDILEVVSPFWVKPDAPNDPEIASRTQPISG